MDEIVGLIEITTKSPLGELMHRRFIDPLSAAEWVFSMGSLNLIDQYTADGRYSVISVMVDAIERMYFEHTGEFRERPQLYNEAGEPHDW